MENMAEDNMSQASHTVSIPFPVFQDMLTNYSHLFEDAAAQLPALHALFEKESRIWPGQYKSVCAFLAQISPPVHQFCALLENPSLLPEEVIPHCYPLLMVLQNTDEQIKKLLPLLTDTILLDITSSKNSKKQQREIARLFGDFERIYADLQMQSHTLFERLYMQTKLYDHIALGRKHALLLQNADSYNQSGQQASELGQKEEARACFERALLLIRKVSAPKAEASILNNLGRTCSALGRKEEACRFLEEALGLARQVADRVEEIRILNNLGLVYADLGHYERATPVLQQAFTLCQEEKDIPGKGRIYNTLGIISNYRGQKDAALQYYEQALCIRRELDDLKGQGTTLLNIGWIYDDLGDKKQAGEYYKRALQISYQVGDRWNEGKTLSNLGQTCADLGQYDQALSHCKQALSILTNVGDRWEETRVLNNLVRIHSKLGEKKQAEEYFKRALKNSRDVDVRDRRGEGRILSNSGLIYSTQDERGEVNMQLEYALELCRAVGDKKGEGWILHNLGRVHLASGKQTEAEKRFEQAWQIRSETGDRRGQGWTLFHIGDLSLKKEDYKKALTYLCAAQKIFQTIQLADNARVQKSIDEIQKSVGKSLFERWVQQITSDVEQLLGILVL